MGDGSRMPGIPDETLQEVGPAGMPDEEEEVMTVGGQTYSVTEEARQGAARRLPVDPAADPRTAAAAAALSGGAGPEETAASLFPESSRRAIRPKVKAAVASGPPFLRGAGAAYPPAWTRPDEPPPLAQVLGGPSTVSTSGPGAGSGGNGGAGTNGALVRGGCEQAQ